MGGLRQTSGRRQFSEVHELPIENFLNQLSRQGKDSSTQGDICIRFSRAAANESCEDKAPTNSGRTDDELELSEAPAQPVRHTDEFDCCTQCLVLSAT